MPTLHISEFSCLREAAFKIAPVTVIIGPQGSGKSVTTKLFYFFCDILNNHIQAAEKGDSIEDYKRQIAKQFAIWFPPSAWGRGRFNINYSAGEFSVRVLRRRSEGRLADSVAVTFSDWFTSFYMQTCEAFNRFRSDEIADLEHQIQVSDTLDKIWRVRELVQRRLSAELGEEYLTSQTFIPAGRAFFTSIGRLVAGIEQAGSLDPVTIKFARLFANLRDLNSTRSAAYRRNRLDSDFLQKRQRFMRDLFGGEVRFEDEAEFVETSDGRKIPFSSLSSGQQELLPMWSLMDYLSEMDAFRRKNGATPVKPSRELVYIEEPEAHLFPSAQSLLMEFLISSIVSERSQRGLIITTHSPYIMSKLNVFLKAGQLARRKKKNQEINEVVPRECWLNEQQLSAFAIEGGELKSLLDDDGMIDGRYLDQISEEISNEFSDLLNIEVGM